MDTKALSFSLNLVDFGIAIYKGGLLHINNKLSREISGTDQNLYDLTSIKLGLFCEHIFDDGLIDQFTSDVISNFTGRRKYKTKHHQFKDVEFYTGELFRVCLIRDAPQDDVVTKLKDAAAEHSPLVITGVEYFEDENYYIPRYTNVTYKNWIKSEHSIIGKQFPRDAGAFKAATAEFAEKYKVLDENNPCGSRYGNRGTEGGARQIITTIEFAGRSENNNKLFVNFTEDVMKANNKNLEAEYRNAIMTSLFDHSLASLGIVELLSDNEKIRFVDSSRGWMANYDFKRRTDISEALITSRGEKRPITIEVYDETSSTWSKICFSHFKEDLFCYIASDITDTKKLIAQLHHAKSQFLGTMSHEIRTPLTGIIGAMDLLLLNTQLSDDDREVLRIGKVCSQQLLIVINDILDFSKIEDNKLLIESIPFSVAQPIKDAIEIISVEAERRKIQVIFDDQNNVPFKFGTFEPPDCTPATNFKANTTTIVGDPTRLRQIILNLLSNAVKFSKVGPIITRVRAFKKMGPDTGYSNLIHFSVEDQGVGISPDDMIKLFQPFSQVDVSVTRKFGGTGLGLSISKKLSELMGGHMWCVSESGKGSVFHFTIATQQITESEAPPEFTRFKEIQTSHSYKGWTPYKSLHLLVAEDNVLNQKIIERILKAAGFTDVTFANNGLEAYQAVQTKNFDIVFMDVMMPIMSGIEATKKIRSVVTSSGQPKIIGLTADAFKENEDQCYDAGMDGFLTKPINPDKLISMVEQHYK